MKNKWLIASILIVILVMLFVAIIYLSWQGIDQARQSGVRWRIFAYDIVSAESDEVQRFSTDGPTTLNLKNDIGNVTILAGTYNEIIIKTHKTAWSSNQADAEAALENLKVIAIQDDNNVTVRVEPTDKVYMFAFRARPDSVAFTITVPANTTLLARSNFGDIAISNATGDANLKTKFGDVSVTNINGALTVDTNSGKVTVQEVQADEKLIDLRSEFGSVSLEKVTAGTINIHSNSGELKLENIEVTGDITLGSEFGDITLLNVDAPSYDLKSNSGKVSLDSARGDVKVHSEFGDIKVTNGEQVTLNLQTNSGTVEYSGSLGSGPHILKTEFGNIDLAIPNDTSLSVDLNTEFGKVKSEFAITLSGEFSEKRLNGTINGGDEALTASTNSGNITISILKPKEKK